MVLDINLIREEKGYNPELIRESQRRRYADVTLVDQVIRLDKQWRNRQFELEQIKKDINKINKDVAQLIISGGDAGKMISSNEENKRLETERKEEVQAAWVERQATLEKIGNLVHDSVPVDNDEENNAVIRTWGEKRTETKLKNHVDLVELLGIADLKKGAYVAGSGGFYLIGRGVCLHQALVDFGLSFLEKKGYTDIQTQSLMRKEIMEKCAQFDEKLYKVTGEGDDKYLIATAEQPLSAYHIDDWIHPSELPIRYSGYSLCFRNEAGSHGRDTLGISGAHQFEKVEQFCLTSPNGKDSWDMHEEMLKNSEEFYQLLKLPYRVVSIVSGALNDATAKKYDLEAWFPASSAFKELVSCSNCTDYLSRKLEIRFGHKKSNDETKQYVHVLNSTLTAVERTMCCILENYQREDGVEIPEVLQDYMGGKTFIPFLPKPEKETLDKTATTQGQPRMVLDLDLFREETGNNPELVRESQRRRYADVGLVDQVIHLDKQCIQRQSELDQIREDIDETDKAVAQLKISGGDAGEMISTNEENKRLETEKEKEVQAARVELQATLEKIGNLVHDSVPVDNDEENNAVIRTWGEKRTETKLKNHVELVELLGIADLKKGAIVAGGRGFYLKGLGVRLNQALIRFGLSFLEKKEYTKIKTPYFMKKYIMGQCAQIAQFDEELYKVTGEGDDKYLIATAEQPLCAYHMDEWIHPSQLPIRYAGYSSCFRKEAGSHGRDTLGIFRVHQFGKVEQFCLTSPNGNDSWDMHEEMLKNSEEFYQLLKLPYRVVSIVSGALNDAAAKKYDLEAWFPASSAFRELVSCSNCTDYQSRKLEIHFGQKKGNDQNKQYVHLLNSTLTATERTMCCILENYQREDGVEIPEVLQDYMDGETFIPSLPKPEKKIKGKKAK